MGNKIVATLVAAILYAVSLHAEVTAPTSQSSTGNQSPVINSQGKVEVNYGLNEEKLNAMLEQREDQLIKKLLAASGDEQERRLLEEQLKTVQAQKADLKKTLEEAIQRSINADVALGKLQGQMPAARIAVAKEDLAKGDTETAEQVFDEVVDKEGKSVALAAFQSGQLAAGRLDYTKAMRQYKKAVILEENNLDYLLAAGQMARMVADYDQAQEWLELLLKIRQKEGKNELSIPRIQDTLARCYEEQGEYGRAESLYKNSLEIKNKLLVRNHPDVAASLNRLAELHLKQGQYEEAKILSKRSLSIIEKIHGKKHLDLAAQSLSTLAELYRQQGAHRLVNKKCI
ncbi:hypothetical protein KKHLCK_15610 [Candidatus Electrothrix laxa]